MKLIVYCKNCNKEIKVKGNFSTRWELSDEKGKAFVLRCTSCSKKATYSVDDVKAKAGNINTIAFLFLFLCIAVVLWLLYPYSTKGLISMFLLPMGALIPALIYSVILREQKRKIGTFNSSRPDSLKSIKFSKRF